MYPPGLHADSSAQFGHNYITTLEKICRMLEKMAAIFEPYEEWVEMITIKEERLKEHELNKTSYPRMLQVLSYLYTDVIEFCFEAITLFTRKRGQQIRMF